jgi:hypothetical protein
VRQLGQHLGLARRQHLQPLLERLGRNQRAGQVQEDLGVALFGVGERGVKIGQLGVAAAREAVRQQPQALV